MTEKELLELVVKRLDKIDISINGMQGEITGLKNDVSGLKNDVSGLKNDVSGLKDEMADLKSRVGKLEEAQLRTDATLENTVNRCIEIMYEGYSLNSERLDRFDVDMIKHNSDIAVAIAKDAYDVAVKKAG